MDFTKLPTDNFYIFLSFAGLALIVFSTTYFSNKIQNIKSKYVELRKATIRDKHRVRFVKEEVQFKASVINLLRKKFTTNYGFEFKLKDENENHKNLEPNTLSDEYIKDYKEIVDAYLELSEKRHEQENYLGQLEFDSTKIEKELTEIEKNKSTFTAILIFSTILMATGLSFWYNRYQSIQDKILELNFEQLDRTIKNDSPKNN